jgi:16S rRNA (guanine527-N7)-methyltransferase
MFHVKHDGSAGVPVSAASVFGDRIDLAERYAEMLTTEGVERGLIGPRETERIWDRHVLNCAAVGEMIAVGTRVADIGSGAGLPGIPLAIARPDLDITLIEPMLRRTSFLEDVIARLALESVTVLRHRAEERVVLEQPAFDFATSRAVASLDKLTRWTMPLLKPCGTMVALKGDRAEAEVEEHGKLMTSLGVAEVKVMRCGVEYLDPPATVVVAHKSAEPEPRKRRPSGRRGR